MAGYLPDVLLSMPRVCGLLRVDAAAKHGREAFERGAMDLRDVDAEDVGTHSATGAANLDTALAVDEASGPREVCWRCRHTR